MLTEALHGGNSSTTWIIILSDHSEIDHKRSHQLTLVSVNDCSMNMKMVGPSTVLQVMT